MGLVVLRAGLSALWRDVPGDQPEGVLRRDFDDDFDVIFIHSARPFSKGVPLLSVNTAELLQPFRCQLFSLKDGENSLFHSLDFVNAIGRRLIVAPARQRIIGTVSPAHIAGAISPVMTRIVTERQWNWKSWSPGPW